MSKRFQKNQLSTCWCSRSAARISGVLLLYLLALFHGSAQDNPDNGVPLDYGEGDSTYVTDLGLQWQIQAAENALQSGFSSLAVRLYRRILDEAQLSPVILKNLNSAYVSALLSEGDYAAAARVLEERCDMDESINKLRLALCRFQTGDIKDAGELVKSIEINNLSGENRSWFYLIQGLLLETGSSIADPMPFFNRAKESASTRTQGLLIETIVARHELEYGIANESQAAALRSRMLEFEGQLPGFQSAKLLAIELYQLGQPQEAVLILETQLRLPSIRQFDFEDQFLLMTGLIAGETSDQGREALHTLLRKKGDHDIQRLALYMLANANIGNTREGSFSTLLNELINSPLDHPLLDELLHIRAYSYLLNGQYNAAQSDARQILDHFPGSGLTINAIKLLAYLAWKREPPQYRTAADLLNQLREETEDPQERIQLGILMADCFFLNGDYSSAADTYGVILRESHVPRDRGQILFQRVLAELRSGRIDQAITHLDEADRAGDFDPLNRWRAEWNLVSAMKVQGRTADAIKRIEALLAKRNTSAVPAELRLRLLWLQAQLSVESKQAEKTPGQADGIIETLAGISGASIDQGQRDLIISHALSLKGEAYFILRQPEQARTVFQELREKYPHLSPAILSYLIEARYYASIGQTVEAQQQLVDLADTYPESEYAPIALYEAACNAELRGISTAYQEAVARLERLIHSYPDSDLVYYARLKQADLARKLNDFGAAQNIYESLLIDYPNHPARPRTEISRADCFLAMGGQNPIRFADAIAIYERLVDLPNIPTDLRLEAGYKWGYAYTRQNNLERAEEAYWIIINQTLADRKQIETLQARGRYWISRSLFDLGRIFEQSNRFEDARKIYLRIQELGLPGQALATAKLNTPFSEQ